MFYPMDKRIIAFFEARPVSMYVQVLRKYCSADSLEHCLESIWMDHVISELCYNMTNFQRNYRKMAMSFSYNSFEKIYEKKKGSGSMNLFYPNLCCYKQILL